MKKLLFVLSLSLGFVLPNEGQAAAAEQNAPAESQMTHDSNYSGTYSQGGQNGQGGYGYGNYYHGEQVDPAQEYCCGEPKEHPCGECYCLYCKYEPCYYNQWRTECEPKTYCKKCCRYVPRYYEKCCVRYVPQNYTQQCCKYEPEYYYVNECRYVQKRVCDRCCKYVPRYYYKRICTPTPCCE